MDWQLIPVGLLVAGAAWYLGHETWRSWQAKKSGCGGGCGCRTKANASGHARVPLISSEQLTSRLSSQNRSG